MKWNDTTLSTLDNYDGRFTPENTTANAAAGYSTTVTEGMAACVQIGSRLTAGQVIGIRPLLGSDWGRIQITCDDAMGTLGRRQLINGLSYESALTNAVVFYPFNEPAGSASGGVTVQVHVDGNVLGTEWLSTIVVKVLSQTSPLLATHSLVVRQH